ncbi:MAG TPA: 1-acyl-sn-glycerol-3-phosphate acyltransferase [Cyclobacteriaceae bacterium]
MNILLYRFFRIIFRIALRFFFRKMEIKGKEHCPATGPVIVVANHPATFFDPIVIAMLLKTPLFFLAKAVIFKSRFAAAFFRFFNVIPIHRAQDDPASVGKNEETFKECYQHLKQNGALMVFPEGISQSVRQLLKIKTGTARIALGAEFQNDFNLGVKILPIGLNYSNQEKFQSNLFISIGEPIPVKNFEAIYRNDEREAVSQLTKLIENKIEEQIINAGDKNLDKLIVNIEKLMKNRILMEWGVSKNDPEFDHEAAKRIAEAVHYFRDHDPDRFSKIEKHINNYFEAIKDVDLPENIFESKRLSLKAFFLYTTYFLSGLPVFLFGFLNNIIPYQISILVAQMSSGLKEYRGAIGFTAGTFIFLFFYGSGFYLIFHLTHIFMLALIYVLLAPVSGIFAFYYRKKLLRFYYKVVFTFSRKKYLIQHLISLRNNIISQLETARKVFLQANS